MSIEAVEAFKISGGLCFATRDEAFANELKRLCDALPDKGEWLKKLTVSQWPSSKKEFRKLVQIMRAWLAAAEESLEQMDEGKGKGQE